MYKAKSLLIFTLIFLFSIPKLNIIAQVSKDKLLTIDEMFKLAYENSKQLKLSRTNIEVAQKATKLAENELMPDFSMSASASYIGDGAIIDRNFTNSVNSPMPHFGNSFTMEVSQIIYSGRSVTNSIANTRIEEQMALINFDQKQQDIRFLLLGYYFDLYKMINQHTIYEKNLEQTHLIIEQIKSRQKVGMALNNDITRQELLLENIRFAIIETENNIKILNNRIVTTLGLSDSTVLIPDTSSIKMNLTDLNRNEVLKSAYNNLPELKLADMNIQRAEKYRQIARAAYFPSIALFAANDFNGPVLIEVPPINKNYNYWYAGIKLKYNISSIYKASRSVNMAEAKKNSAETAKQVAKEKTLLEVENAYIRYRESFDNLVTAEKGFKLSQENFNVINNLYLNNMALITEMLDASNAKLNAELQVVNAKINTVFLYYQLKYVSGTL